MKVGLSKRRHGAHIEIANCEIPGDFDDYAKLRPGSSDDYAIEEQKILDALPEDFLPVAPRMILVTVDDDNGGTGQTGLTLFRDWAKYFDAYSLNLMK